MSLASFLRRATSSDSTAGEAGPKNASGDLQREIQVTTEWAKCLEERGPSMAPRQIEHHEVWLIDNILSDNECASLLKLSEVHGFGATDYPKDYRGNLRLMTTDRSLTEAMWLRLQPLVPATLDLGGDIWDACGLNECWRLAKYYPGDRFGKHCDASFARSGQRGALAEESMLTVNIYMNGGFEGGKTRFYFGDSGAYSATRSRQRGSLTDKTAVVETSQFAVEPEAGRCLLFRQPPGECYLHDGEELRSGVKYLFRSDVMYRRRE